MKKSIGLALALTIVACGNAKVDETTSSDPPGEDTSRSVSVRLLGVRGAGPVRVQVSTIELSVDGTPFPVQRGGSEIDLGNDQSAWAVSTFDLPPDARKVSFKVKFHPAGVIERDGKSQLLDLNGPPISVLADAEQLRLRKKVVVEIDLARSLVEFGEQVFLFPEFIVRY
ncbi:hypothetical protein [Myxococcus qinghaiensis]|uniref:hypothetical protein n=1 Tax=Myxococcus qinghaiensis TaxID=2906758 RepID=UPI0020A72B13|nr:hypothetical protein [Myxococcus qinghaiensis]MCP3167881.1 hypothetical protein [Myxococcus qinghaiensis]